jgi:hypothetical protein
MRTLERKKSSAGRLAAASTAAASAAANRGGEKNEFDDLISALRTGDVFAGSEDRFRVRCGGAAAGRAARVGGSGARASPPRAQRSGSFMRERSGGMQ